MAYLLIANPGQSKYARLGNGLASQYSVKNNQYSMDLILAADIIKIAVGVILEQENLAQTIKKLTYQGKKSG